MVNVGGSASAVAQPCGMVHGALAKDRMGGGARDEVYALSWCRRPSSLLHAARVHHSARPTIGGRSGIPKVYGGPVWQNWQSVAAEFPRLTTS
ncbi:MAG: hypothetical protein MJZ87_10395 [Bacteroidales bacterium]|nr:hypothetical protein [Bacteroidales bacterium]